MSEQIKYVMTEERIPLACTTFKPICPRRHPRCCIRNRKPSWPEDLAAIFPMGLIQQEVSTEREIEIPEPVREIYRQWRPTPLHRARRPGKALGTPARIYYKYEGVSPPARTSEYRRGAGLLQQAGRCQTPGHRDRGWPVGLVAGHGLRVLWARLQSLHGPRQL